MPIKLHISPRLVKSVSSLYNDPNRIFMEYIDNSLDSAGHWFSDESVGYTRPIEITLKIEGKNKKDGRVTIADNCFGITNFKKVVQSIGNSDKKAQGFTNGQFGYGIYSFMAACEKLEVFSKLHKEDALYIPILRKQFDEARQEDVQFPDPKIKKDFPSISGTVIILSEFDQDSWKQINTEELKKEMEKHFELLLRRKNLAIKIINNDRNIYKCQAFDYESLEGEIYEDYITDFITQDKRIKAGSLATKIKNPVHIFLKMTKGITINRPPVFISKGRRICEIKDVKSFRSKHKSDIWDHPNVTGFIDLSDLLGPTIARNDFRNNNYSKALYNTLYELEELISEFVKKANLKSEERHYQQLEDILNKELSKLARIDSMNYRTDYIKGGDISIRQDGTGVEFEEGLGGKDFTVGGTNRGEAVISVLMKIMESGQVKKRVMYPTIKLAATKFEVKSSLRIATDMLRNAKKVALIYASQTPNHRLIMRPGILKDLCWLVVKLLFTKSIQAFRSAPNLLDKERLKFQSVL